MVEARRFRTIRSTRPSKSCTCLAYVLALPLAREAASDAMSHTLFRVNTFPSFTVVALAAVSLALGSVVVPSEAASAVPRGTAAAGESTAPTPAAKSKQVKKAEKLVLDQLPDAPIWEGLTVNGVEVSTRVVCVDRTWAPGGGPDDKGGTAGYVVVKFPKKKSGKVKLGKPQDGLCADYAPVAATPAPKVAVPKKLQKMKGLLVSTKFGAEWPLTVPYAVVRCKNITAGGMKLNAVTLDAPDGTRYAVNGTAQDHTSYPEIDAIWAADPNIEGLKIDISPVINAGLKLCE